MRRPGQERLARARRQRAVHRLRRRRPRRRRWPAPCCASSATPARPASPPTGSSSTSRCMIDSWPVCAEAAAGLVVGAGTDARSSVGPLIDRAGVREGLPPRRRRRWTAAPSPVLGGAPHELGRHVPRTDRARRRLPRQRHVARGDVRAGRRRAHVHRRARGDRDRQRHALRPGRLHVQPRRRARVPRLRAARVRDPRHQHRLHLGRGGAVRRRQGIGHRARGLQVRGRRLGRDPLPVAGRDRPGDRRDAGVHAGPGQGARVLQALRGRGHGDPARDPRPQPRLLLDGDRALAQPGRPPVGVRELR